MMYYREDMKVLFLMLLSVLVLCGCQSSTEAEGDIDLDRLAEKEHPIDSVR